MKYIASHLADGWFRVGRWAVPSRRLQRRRFLSLGGCAGLSCVSAKGKGSAAVCLPMRGQRGVSLRSFRRHGGRQEGSVAGACSSSAGLRRSCLSLAHWPPSERAQDWLPLVLFPSGVGPSTTRGLKADWICIDLVRSQMPGDSFQLGKSSVSFRLPA